MIKTNLSPLKQNRIVSPMPVVLLPCLTGAAERLKAEADDLKGKTANLQSFMNLISRVGAISELTEELARMFIEKVIIHEAVFRAGTKRAKESQQVDVYFSYIGRFDTGGEQSCDVQSTERNGGVIMVK